jgi:hypothetical protein
MGNIDGFGQYKIGGTGGSGGGTVTTTYSMSAVIINFAVGGTPEFFDWSGVLTPSGTNNSVLPINEADLKIVRIGMKYLDTTAFQCDATFDYSVEVQKLTTPTAATNSARTTYTGGTSVITLSNSDSGTFFVKDSGVLDIDISQGDMLAITGNVNSGSATGGSNEEVLCNVTFQKTYTVS